MSFLNNTIKDAKAPSFDVPNKNTNQSIVPTDTSGDQTNERLVEPIEAVDPTSLSSAQSVGEPKNPPAFIRATFQIGDSIYSGEIPKTSGEDVFVTNPAAKTGLFSRLNPFGSSNKGGKTTKRSRRGRGRTLRKKRRN